MSKQILVSIRKSIQLICTSLFKSIFILFYLLLIACTESYTELDYIAPEKAGFSSSKLNTLKEFCDTSGSSSMLLIYDGKILFNWGDIHRKHTVHSIRKALLNSIFGIYVGRGVIDTNWTLNDLNIDDIEPSLTEMEKNARVADLLKSRSAIFHPSAAESKSMRISRPERSSARPGELYYYNNWDFNVLGYIFEQTTGKSIYDAFYEEIAKPIGMIKFKGEYTEIEISEDDTDIPLTDGFYQYEKDKSKYPAYHFRMSAYDMALYGLLYLNNGRWNEKQLIPEEWIRLSTKAYSVTNNDIGIGYGMLWRVLMKTKDSPSISYFHTGAGIHMLAVYPSSNLILVHRVDTENDYDFPQKNLYKMISLVFSQ